MHQFLAAITLLLTLNFCSSANTNSHSGARHADENLTDQSNDGSEKENTYFNNQKQDIAKIEGVMKKVRDIDDINRRVVAITQEFIGVPYVGFTLNTPPKEQLYVNTTGVDCSTFVETVIALALASEKEDSGIDDYLKILKSLRYRDGRIDGFPSRLHYTSEWAIDNGRRGNFKEIGGDYDLSESRVKTIDFMTHNRNLYPAMAEDRVFEAIKQNEKSLKNLKFSYIPAAVVDKAAKNFLKSGDIVGIVTNKPGLDVSHVAVLDIRNGVPYLIHASSKYKKVVNDTVPLKDYLKRQGSPGIRVFRLTP